MFKFSENPATTLRFARAALRTFGIRRLSRATGIPLSTVSRTVRNLKTARFSVVLELLSAALRESA